MTTTPETTATADERTAITTRELDAILTAASGQRTPIEVWASRGYEDHEWGCGHAVEGDTVWFRYDDGSFLKCPICLPDEIRRGEVVLTNPDGLGALISGFQFARVVEGVPDSRRQELLERTARFYLAYLWESGEAEETRDFLLGVLGLSREDLRELEVGYAPSDPVFLMVGATRDGFSPADLVAAGLATSGGGGIYDQFTGQLVRPVRGDDGAVLRFAGIRSPVNDGIPF